MSPAFKLQVITTTRQTDAMDDMASKFDGFVEARAAELAAEARNRRQSRLEDN